MRNENGELKDADEDMMSSDHRSHPRYSIAYATNRGELPQQRLSRKPHEIMKAIYEKKIDQLDLPYQHILSEMKTGRPFRRFFYSEYDKAVISEIGRAVQQECRDRSRMPSSA
eukprot:TRINITY_DN10920_c1_g2_i4.p1 TRINITY_DN10920_c1_g2~~TRINITY_DN10920_c1_g2_i4.p1  ORF type:complete len:113 (-),score=16.04 TRINITY_DN10920_c1_g2_i4:28-366(-)